MPTSVQPISTEDSPDDDDMEDEARMLARAEALALQKYRRLLKGEGDGQVDSS